MKVKKGARTSAGVGRWVALAPGWEGGWEGGEGGA